MIRIEVAGQPVAKGRPHIVRRKRKDGTVFLCPITPERTVSYEACVALAGRDAMVGRDLLEGPVAVTVFAHFLTPKRGKKEGDWHVAKPDADNVFKVVDGLNGIVWRDDSQVASAQIVKTYANSPRLVIEVRPL